MKKIAILSVAVILNISCNAQEEKKKEKLLKGKYSQSQSAVEPKGTWKVNKEFDENGNLTRYDSIYSWSSGDDLDKLSALDSDSTLLSIQSKFYRNFSRFSNQDFDDVFSSDSLFMNSFLDDDFFTSPFEDDFMDIDKMHKGMGSLQKKFLEKYRSELKEPEEDNTADNE